MAAFCQMANRRVEFPDGGGLSCDETEWIEATPLRVVGNYTNLLPVII